MRSMATLFASLPRGAKSAQGQEWVDDERAELDAKLARGSADIEAGRTVDASEVLAKLRTRREAKNL
jgi:predicted transcriptional regulator